MKKILCLLLAAVMMIGIFAACGPGDAQETAPPAANGGDPAPPVDGGDDPAPGGDDPAPPPAPADATVLTFWTFGDTHADYYAEAQRIWNERNPDRQIYLETTVIAFAQMHENLLMALQTGSGAPDIVDVEVGRAEMFLNTPDPAHIPFLPQNQFLEPFMPYLVYSRLEPWARGGNYFGVCYHVGSVLMFYNIRLFEEAGISWDDIVTWDDFIEQGQAFVAHHNLPFIQVESENIWGFSAMVAQQHSDYVIDGRPNLDSPEAIRAATMLQSFVHTHGIGQSMVGGNIDAEEFYAEITTDNFGTFMAPAWFMGRYINLAQNQSGNIGLAPMPVFEAGNNRSSSAGGTMTAVTNQIDPAVADLALEFVAFSKADRDMAMLQWTLLGFDPVRWDVLEDPALRTAPSPALDFFGPGVFDVLLDVSDETASVVFSGENAFIVRDYLNVNVLPNIIAVNNMTAEEALREGQAFLLGQLGLD